jgi:hypothetical protein
LIAAAMHAMALATAVAGGGAGAARTDLPVVPCHGFDVPVAFEVEGDVSGRFLESLSTDSRAQSCRIASRRTLARAGHDDPAPALALDVVVEAHPGGYRPDAQARRHLRDYRLAVAMETHAMWDGAYAISGDWSPPSARIEWQCRTAVATAQLGASSGDESMVCVHADAERVVVVRAHVAREAAAQRDAVVATLAAIRRTGDAAALESAPGSPP